MAKGKSGKADVPPDATPTTPQAESDELLGLLGGQLDVLAGLGLGFGASPRARELVMKGLIFEHLEELRAQLVKLKPGRGRPRKDTLNIDVERAAAVLGADDFLREKFGRGARTQREAIEFAILIEQMLFNGKVRDKLLLDSKMVSFSRLQDSVSKGLRGLGEAGERFLKKSP